MNQESSKIKVKNSKSQQGKIARDSGYFAESLACLFLSLNGYKILARNYKIGRGTNAGEIDIIATHQNTLVFIEVKSRQSAEIVPYCISDKAKRRICNTAELFLSEHSHIFKDFSIRFDAILFTKGKLLPTHIKDAWRIDWF